MTFLGKPLTVLRRAERLGTRTLSNGTHLIGYVPHVAPEAWLHQLFAPLSDAAIEELESTLGKALPPVMRAFFHVANGLTVFSGSFAIYGRRATYVRSGEDVWQPFDILTPNRLEQPHGAKSEHLFVGGYGWDGSLVYMDSTTSKTYRCSRQSVDPLNEWDSFEEMLAMETIRIALLFDDTGRQIDEGLPTTP